MYKHIKEFLPELMKEMNRRISDCEGLLRELGPEVPASNADKTQFLWKIVHEFTMLFKNSISGTYEKSTIYKQ